MDNPESNQLQVLANDLYIIHEKIIKTDALIKIVKEKSKRCNKLEKLHKKLLDTHNQLQLKQTEYELKLNNCLMHHGPLEKELNELKIRLANAEALHSDYVNTAELKYQSVCQELENAKKIQTDTSPKIKEKRTKKSARGLTKEELISKLEDLTIEFELTKSELENTNKEIIAKDKIINKYEYEKQILNDKIETLNNKLNKKQTINYVNKINEVPSIENDFITDILPAISELDNTLPILSDSICEDIVKSVEKEFTSFGVQTDDLLPNNKSDIKNEKTVKSFGIQTNLINKSFHSFGCQTNFETNCVQIQTDDDLLVEYVKNLRRDKLKTSSSQTYFDDIINVENVLLEMTTSIRSLSPLSPMPIDKKEDDLIVNESNSICIGPDEIIPSFVNCYCQTDEITNKNSCTQTITTKEYNLQKVDFNCQTDKIKSIESNTQTEILKKIDGATQTQNETFNTNTLKNNLSSPNNQKTPQGFWETKLKNKLNTPNSKISKKYKTTKNKLLEHLKLSNLDFKQILEKYLSEGNGPTLFVSPKILKSSQLNNFNSCKHQNPFMNISNRLLFKQCHSNVHECPCCHSCNMQRNYPSCTTLQCNISCNGYPGYCNHSHRIKIKHNSNAVIVSSDSDAEEYHLRNYYKNKFKNKYRAKHNCKCKEFTNEMFYNRLNSLKREAKTSDTDASISVCKRKKKRRKIVLSSSTSSSSSDSDESSSESINSRRDKRKRHSQIAQENTNNNLTQKTNSSQNNSTVCEDTQSIQMEHNIDIEKPQSIAKTKTNENSDNLLNNVNTQNKDKTENSKDKNIMKPAKEKPTKIKRLRKLLNKTPLNYNKSNILTRSMSKNIQNESNKNMNSTKPDLDLFGSFSDSSLNSDSENVNKKIQTRNNINKTRNKTSLNMSPNKNQVKITSNKNQSPDKNNLKITSNIQQLKTKISPTLKIPRKLELTPLNHVYKRPERRQTVPIGPLSPEPVNCEFVQPKIIPLEQINSSENSTNVNSSNFASELSSIHTKPIEQNNTNTTNINTETSILKQNKIKLQEKRYIIKMISDVATMDWDRNLMNTVVENLLSKDALDIAMLIVSEAAIDHDEQLDKSFTPPAPLLKPSQQKLLVLINRLDSQGLTGLKKKVITLTEKRILSEKSLTNILGLTRIYVALCKIQYDIEGMRIFCCNAAYYLGDLFLPIMFIVLTMWGDVLPMASADVPLAVTLVQVIQNKTCSTPGYNTNTLNRLLSDCYEYKRGEITNDQVMDKLVECFIENPSNSIFTSILILCKNLPSKWRFSQIKKHFIPLIDKYKIDSSKSTLVSITLTLINRIKDMFVIANDKEYINELVNVIANFSSNISNNC